MVFVTGYGLPKKARISQNALAGVGYQVIHINGYGHGGTEQWMPQGRPDSKTQGRMSWSGHISFASQVVRSVIARAWCGRGNFWENTCLALRFCCRFLTMAHQAWCRSTLCSRSRRFLERNKAPKNF